MALTIQINPGEPGTCRVKLEGSLDAETSPELDKQMETVWAEPATRSIQLDLHGLAYISSMGLGSLAKIKKMAFTRGGGMVVVGAQPQIARIFAVVRLLPNESLLLNHQEADEYLASIQQKILDRLKPDQGNP